MLSWSECVCVYQSHFMIILSPILNSMELIFAHNYLPGYFALLKSKHSNNFLPILAVTSTSQVFNSSGFPKNILFFSAIHEWVSKYF